MPKGFFTQAVMILLEKPVTLEQIEEALDEFAIMGQTDGQADDGSTDEWYIAGPSVVLEYDSESNGKVMIDIAPEPWPDDMGGPVENMLLFTAWATGHFGPAVFPGCLARAVEHSWSWDEAADVVAQHKCFIRVRLSYIMSEANADSIAATMPEDYDEAACAQELAFLDRVSSALMSLPGALCHFNPSGEVVLPPEELISRIESAEGEQVANLSSWCNVRLFRVSEEWGLMDTVGNEQLELPDIEICLPPGLEPEEVDGFLRSLTWYLLTNGQVIQTGNTINGPGDQLWKAEMFQNPISTPPREVIFWTPADLEALPEDFPQREPDSDGEDSDELDEDEADGDIVDFEPEDAEDADDADDSDDTDQRGGRHGR